MNAEPMQGLCMICGKDESYGPMNMEHFVPECLWAKGNRPDKIIKLPAHESCNASYALDDEYFRNVLIRDTDHPEAVRIIEGPFKRSLQRRRQRQVAKGVAVKPILDAAMRQVLSPLGVYLGFQPTIIFDEGRIRRSLHKVIRGLFYAKTGRSVLETTEVKLLPPEVLQSELAEQLFSNRDPVGFGDDVFLCRFAFDRKHPDAMCCEMEFYRRHRFLGGTYPADLP